MVFGRPLRGGGPLSATKTDKKGTGLKNPKKRAPIFWNASYPRNEGCISNLAVRLIRQSQNDLLHLNEMFCYGEMYCRKGYNFTSYLSESRLIWSNYMNRKYIHTDYIPPLWPIYTVISADTQCISQIMFSHHISIENWPLITSAYCRTISR